MWGENVLYKLCFALGKFSLMRLSCYCRWHQPQPASVNENPLKFLLKSCISLNYLLNLMATANVNMKSLIILKLAQNAVLDTLYHTFQQHPCRSCLPGHLLWHFVSCSQYIWLVFTQVGSGPSQEIYKHLLDSSTETRILDLVQVSSPLLSVCVFFLLSWGFFQLPKNKQS